MDFLSVMTYLSRYTGYPCMSVLLKTGNCML